MKVLVTGGAGYIGSHAVKALREAGHTPVVFDKLDRGHRAAVPTDVRLEQGDILETERLIALMQEEQIEAVMHFAALAYVGESVKEPLLYYENNTAGSLSLLKAIDAAGVRRLVFSSTCATHGEPEKMPITEDMPQHPINPYGMSKLMVEHIIRDYAATQPEFAYALLRYFNVAGSASDGSIGEDHTPESHLIPLAIMAGLGRRDQLTIFGTDYPTPDGTCIRDYIHVEDLIDAHITVMKALQPGDSRVYGLGTGAGFSVRQILDVVGDVMGKPVPAVEGQRREGDPPMLYADPSRIERELGWKAKYTEPTEMVRSAYMWFKDHPNGYGD